MAQPTDPPPGWTADQLRTSPELFPIEVDLANNRAAFVRLSRVDYERASFLDGRLQLQPVATPSLDALAKAAEGAPIACDWIFHIGHVGSTLISRVLGTHPQVFSLREPQALRTFAQSPDTDARRAALPVFAALYSRTWLAPQRAVIKATSIVSDIAAELLALSPDSRAILLTVAPEVYIPTILGGPNSVLEMRAQAPARLARLHAHIGASPWRLEELSDGEIAAMSWNCEMAGLVRAARAAPDRTVWLNFDRFLADRTAGLARVLQALDREAGPETLAALAGSAYFDRYSKAPEYAYGARVRDEVLAEARRAAGAEIARGLAWLERAAADWPAVARLLAA
ncbi:hypothetical protein [Phenylobacterium soli]|uniref:Sulfotransferase family protein n=1 Tax=Phenylobacterium soli TaxID=2170551 RepID=A0A328AHR5_9CAUL|nr:hypothetical protein [Phenylobacterium soli]RAK54453.1 hypothetical protein DJ017_07905 [Phenylobacterium soli]